jgi:hypothetical protein
VSRKRRAVTERELRALGLTPGLVGTRYDADGRRATVAQLAPESDERRKIFAARLSSGTDNIKASEGEY